MALTNHLDNGTQLIKHSLIIGLVHFVLPNFLANFSGCQCISFKVISIMGGDRQEKFKWSVFHT